MSMACFICLTFSAVQAFKVSCTTDCSAHRRRPKAARKVGSASFTTVDFHQPPSPCQHTDKDIVELVTRRVLDRLLRNQHRLSDRTEQVQVLESHAQGGQTGTRSVMMFRRYDRFVADDGPPLSWFPFTSDFFHPLTTIASLVYHSNEHSSE